MRITTPWLALAIKEKGTDPFSIESLRSAHHLNPAPHEVAWSVKVVCKGVTG